MPRRRAAPRRRAFDDDDLEPVAAAPKGRKSGVAPYPEEMPKFSEELKNSKGKARTFMALLSRVSRPGTGNLALRFVLQDPEKAADDDSDTEDKPEQTETEVRLGPPWDC